MKPDCVRRSEIKHKIRALVFVTALGITCNNGWRRMAKMHVPYRKLNRNLMPTVNLGQFAIRTNKLKVLEKGPSTEHQSQWNRKLEGDDAVLPKEPYPLSYHPFHLFGHFYALPHSSMGRPAVRHFLEGHYFEPQTHEIMSCLLDRWPGSIVHAGTFFGDMVPHFSELVGSSGSVFAFEPNTKNYLLAQMAVEQNGLSNVVLVNAALGPRVSQQKIVTLHGKQEIGGESSVGKTGTTCVPQLTIDMFGIRNLSVVHLDVEGYEGEALKGALQTIAREQPVVAIEDNLGIGTYVLEKAGYVGAGASPGLRWYSKPDRSEEVKGIIRKALRSWNS